MSTSTTTTAAGSVLCKCGCGLTTSNVYRPGHDAKHVSILLEAVLSGATTREEARKELPSAALQIKLDSAVANAIARHEERVAKAALRAARQAETEARRAEQKAAKKAAKEAAKAEKVLTEVKIGRWWYPIVEAGRDGDQFLIAYRTKDGEIKEAHVDADKLR